MRKLEILSLNLFIPFYALFIYVFGSLIYQGIFGERIPKVQIPRDSKDIRRKSVKHLETTNILQVLNKVKRFVDLGHLTGKVNVNALYMEEEGSASFDRTIVFARVCPSKIIDRQFDPIEKYNQKIPSWKGVHAMLSFKSEDTTEKKLLLGITRSFRGDQQTGTPYIQVLN